MARDYAPVKVSIWNDPEFRALEVAPQHLYFVLVSQARLTHAGTLDYSLNRLAMLAANQTVAEVQGALVDLVDARFVVTDHRTDELLVRTYIRHSGLLSQPNVVKAMVKDYAAVMSTTLRGRIDEELVRAQAEQPRLQGWKVIAASLPHVARRFGADEGE